MEIKKQYLQKYLDKIAIEQIADEYQAKGYSVSKDEKLGKGFPTDLIARKGNETIVIEVKTGKMSPDKKQNMSDLANYIREQGDYKFLVAVATPPREKKLEISGIEVLLTQIIQNNFPSDLDQLSTRTCLEDITDIDIDEISIDGSAISVSGSGVLNVELHFGSDGRHNEDDGFKTHDSFPFDFKVTLESDAQQNLNIINVDMFKVDTSSYYGNEKQTFQSF